MNIEARVATQPWSCSYNNLNDITVLHRVILPNLLTIEACRRSPDACIAKACAHLLMNLHGNISYRRAWLQGHGLLIDLFVVTQVDADYACQLPHGLLEHGQAFI